MEPLTIATALGGAALGSGVLDGDAPNDYAREMAGLDALKTYKLRGRLHNSPLELAGRTGAQDTAIGNVGQYGDISPAMSYFNNMLTGGFDNPYADRMFDKASSQVRQKMDSQFARSGRYGSDAHQNVMADAYNDLGTNIYGKERAYIDSAARALPSVAGQGINNAMAMYGLGEQDRMLQQQMDNPEFYTAMTRLGALGPGMAPLASQMAPLMDEGNQAMGALGGAMGFVGLGQDLGLLGGGE